MLLFSEKWKKKSGGEKVPNLPHGRVIFSSHHQPQWVFFHFFQKSFFKKMFFFIQKKIPGQLWEAPFWFLIGSKRVLYTSSAESFFWEGRTFRCFFRANGFPSSKKAVFQKTCFSRRKFVSAAWYVASKFSTFVASLPNCNLGGLGGGPDLP